MRRTAATPQLIGLSVLLVLTLAACSSGDGDGRPSASPSRSASASATATDAPRPSTGPSTDPTTPAQGGDTTVPIPEETPADDPSEAPPSDFPATALVTYAGWDAGSGTLQAAGIVSGATDTSGTCTFTATKDGTTREQRSDASVASTSINCAQVSFPRSQLGTGTWSVALRYAIGGKSVTSNPTTVEVP
ncbi:hypothetical protein HP467_07855 [Curtobacterium albidum]|uniref:Uncharacterized protein n=1 Tax=Curtobacterium citreum TaxID=2036 RepID=A0A850DU70_9MICO|nr:hypothetical protein [Curtobacterium albidum]NUU28025.1 hypothetical protein [Curtobacterium albidum]